MKKLIKSKLDFNRAWIYLEDNLRRSNTLSDEVLNKINFENGSFFTLLPIDARLDNLYNFECGGILTQNPIQEYIMAETDTHVKIGRYSIISNIRKDLSEIIVNEMQANRVCCIFDDVDSRSKDKHLPDPSLIRRLVHNDEVYYFLENNNVSTRLVEQCLKRSNAIWHSLCILTKVSLDKARILNITLEDIKSICLNAVEIIVGAYDGEGYIFWQKNKYNA